MGDELLSGKVEDRNLCYLTRELRALGVPLRLGAFVGDDFDAIADALHLALRRADIVLTSGGVGPTHDDVTLAAVARALRLELRPDPGITAAIHAHYGERVNDELLSMALVPEGAELIQPAPFFLPIFRVERVYVFPGDPLALRKLFEPWKEALRRSPYHLARLELDVDEGEVAPTLSALSAERPEIAIGSYPRYDEGAPYRVLVTLEGKEREPVADAARALRAEIETKFGEAALLRAATPDADPAKKQ